MEPQRTARHVGQRSERKHNTMRRDQLLTDILREKAGVGAEREGARLALRVGAWVLAGRARNGLARKRRVQARAILIRKRLRREFEIDKADAGYLLRWKRGGGVSASLPFFL